MPSLVNIAKAGGGPTEKIHPNSPQDITWKKEKKNIYCLDVSAQAHGKKNKLKINRITFLTDASASKEGGCRIGPPSKASPTSQLTTHTCQLTV